MKYTSGLLLFVCGFALSFFGMHLATHQLCDHFTLQDIYSGAETKLWATDPGDYPKEIFQQPYHYLGKGSQSYVFASEDGNYVIKFFRASRLEPPSFLGGPAFMQKIQEEQIRTKQKECWELFASCHIAFTELKKECGLIYMHLNSGGHLNDLLIYDALNRPHRVSLRESAFFIQKRADPLMQRLAEGDVEKSMEQIALLLKSRFEKGIDDHDPVLQKNTGFVGNQPIFIDIGSFYHNKSAKREQYESALQMTRKLGHWLDEKEPGLSSELDRALKTIL